MPVTGTPHIDSSSASATCSSQALLSPQLTTVFGCEVKARQRSIETSQELTPTVTWTMVDRQGNPVDLSTCGTFVDDDSDTGRIVLKIREVVRSHDSTATTVTVTGRGVVAQNGTVLFDIPAAATEKPGVYLAEARVYSTEGTAIFSNQFYFVVNRSVFASSEQCGYPPTLAEIRLYMMDSGPEDNPLLDNVQYDVAQIAAATEMPILYWNESPPPINQRYDTKTFPHRYNWLKGIVAQLYLMAAHFYRRNRLPHQAGGVQIDDLGKADEYEKYGRIEWEEYKTWVLQTKVRLNAEAAIQWCW